jgi:hypothetical protein
MTSAMYIRPGARDEGLTEDVEQHKPDRRSYLDSGGEHSRRSYRPHEASRPHILDLSYRVDCGL